MFTQEFKTPARHGDAITCEVDGITYRARIVRDTDSGAPDKEEDGFWPSLDPKADGYIGENPARSFEVQMRDCKAATARYAAGKMIYCGVVVTASKAGVELLGEGYEHAVWGVDINWPHGDNGYLRTVANELLNEARPVAAAALLKAVDVARDTLKALEAPVRSLS